jgi:hypothetical protein
MISLRSEKWLRAEPQDISDHQEQGHGSRALSS